MNFQIRRLNNVLVIVQMGCKKSFEKEDSIYISSWIVRVTAQYIANYVTIKPNFFIVFILGTCRLIFEFSIVCKKKIVNFCGDSPKPKWEHSGSSSMWLILDDIKIVAISILATKQKTFDTRTAVFQSHTFIA